MKNRKRIEDITVEDLQSRRWCYHLTEDDDSAFEYVVSDAHPDFSEDIFELELAEFTFSNGTTAWGLYDGAEAFNIMTQDAWYSFWYGTEPPEAAEIERLTRYLKENNLLLPVIAHAKWSKTEKTYRGIQYLNNSGEIEEVVI
ncbi:MAG: hypothetical protein H6999_09920 [Hahellaceae bacterium]|nr:hypothetical protein [Hahellaceae bacterium]MCP5170061.1 hypothetical protein [Hahellaceae bacterium]